MKQPGTTEDERLQADAKGKADWRGWGTYLTERQWGTVREDLSKDGNSWQFGYDEARTRAYGWGEDGLLGWTDRNCLLCYSLSLWNGKDAFLKERLFGLTNPEGNHGEDVKELYYYLEATPTYSYAKGLYKYPQAAFPYEELRKVNADRGLTAPEYELLDTGIFAEERYFDVEVEYAKHAPDDTLIRISVTNNGPEDSELVLVPTLTFRNTWAEGHCHDGGSERPELVYGDERRIVARHEVLGPYGFSIVSLPEGCRLERTLFTENESAQEGGETFAGGSGKPSKDGFSALIAGGDPSRISADAKGTKAAFLLHCPTRPGSRQVISMRLCSENAERTRLSGKDFQEVFKRRKSEADAFYDNVMDKELSAQERLVHRQAFSGLLWSKQFYSYFGVATVPKPEGQTAQTDAARERDKQWRTLHCHDLLTVPDKWEYPWFAAWDSAFQLVALSRVDVADAKSQLMLLLDQRYMHPDGQLPAYENKFGDVNPPVHAWSALRIFQQDKGKRDDQGDYTFLKAAFNKLVLNFAWWVNRNDPRDNNLFAGGFLGLDNIGVFDRSTLPDNVHLSQADGTAWMAFFCSNMLSIALEIATHDQVYEGMAIKFFTHYIAIIDSFNNLGGSGLWNEEDGFFFDKLIADGKEPRTISVRAIVGIIPLYALCIVPKHRTGNLERFMESVRWYRQQRPDLAHFIGEAHTDDSEYEGAHYIGLVQKHRLPRIAQRLFDPKEFLGDHGIRALSKVYEEEPFTIELAGKQNTVKYTAAEGDGIMFGGNSNWRGPVWFPVNYLLLESLERYSRLLGRDYTMEFPTGSGAQVSLREITRELARRLASVFLPDERGRRPCHGNEARYLQTGPWKDLVLFNEYFSGDDGRGVGASHQTGWTALVPLCTEMVYRLGKPVV